MSADNSTAVMENWMRRALELARRAWGKTHPNPMVGALIVEDGKIVAEGWHERSGELHAERIALNNLGRAPKPDATMVVTLEPCSTHGRTGACCEAIARAGIARVIVGATDPFAGHAGNGFALLRHSGVEVISGILAEECTDLNLIFNHWIVRREPFVALKTATSLDGRIASRHGESQWLTSTASRADVMRWRRYYPAIATSSGTVLADDPRLTSRREGVEEWCPVRFVFDRRLRTAERLDLQVFSDAFREKTVVVTTEKAEEKKRAALEKNGVLVWTLPASTERDFFRAFKTRCAEENLPGVWVEGGGTFLGAWLKSGEADYLYQYVAPVLFADAQALPAFQGSDTDLKNLFKINELKYERTGDDGLIRGYLKSRT